MTDKEFKKLGLGIIFNGKESRSDLKRIKKETNTNQLLSFKRSGVEQASHY